MARWFFVVGGASGTLAKTISAYDMAFSDAIYGKGERYVSQTRLHNMLDYEFALLIEDSDGPDSADGLVQRLSVAMARPFMLSGNEVQVNASIGIATATPDDTADDLLRNADVAMYTAKRLGKGRCETYQSQMYADVRERLEMETALRGAIDRGELSLVYQPIVCFQTGCLHGVEALVRWDHPRYGHLLPQHFVPLAEETGLIVLPGPWVLSGACPQG